MLTKKFFESIVVSPSDFIIDNETIWFIHAQVNALFKYDMNTKELDFCTSVPGINFLNPAPLFSKIISCGESLFLIPWNAKEIEIYNKELNIFDKFDVSEKYKDELLFKTAFSYKDEIVCIPYFAKSSLLVINTSSKEVSTKVFLKNIKLSDEAYIKDFALIPNGRILCCVGNDNRLFVFDYENNNCKIVDNICENSLDTCAYLSGKLYVKEERKGIIHILDNEYKEIEHITTECDSAKIYSSGKNYLLIMPNERKEAYVYNVEDKRKVNTLEWDYFNGFPFVWNNNSIGCVSEDEELNDYFCDGISNSLINLKTGEIIKLCLTKKSAEKLHSIYSNESFQVTESTYYGLDSFVSHL